MKGEIFNQTLDSSSLLTQDSELTDENIDENSLRHITAFDVLNVGISLSCCVFTAFGSVAELIGQQILKIPGKNYGEMLKADTTKTLLSTVIPGVLAVNGIVSLNISGLNGVKNELKHGEFLDFIGRFILSVPSGVAMAVLARDINLPFIVGEQHLSKLINNIVFFGAGEVVGLGIGGILLNNFKSFYNKIVSSYKDSIKQKFFDRTIATLSDFYRLDGRTWNMRQVNNALANQNFNDLRADKVEALTLAFQIICDSVALFEMPTKRNHWITNTFINTFSFGLSAIGTWSFKALIESGTQNISELARQSLAWSGFGANLLFWTFSLTDFIKNILNPANYFGDTWSESAEHDMNDPKAHNCISRIFFFVCTVCFGAMIALIAFLTAEKDADESLVWAEGIAGFVINALIGNLSINSVWKYEYEMIEMSESDKMQLNLSSMSNLFNKCQDNEKKAVVHNIKSMFYDRKSIPLLVNNDAIKLKTETVADRVLKHTNELTDEELNELLSEMWK